MRTTERYTVPLTGTIKDWETLEGDPDDPVTVAGPAELALKSSFDWSVVPEVGADRRVETRLRSVDLDAGTAEVDVIAHDLFHAHLASRMNGGQTPEEIAAACGRSHLRRPPRAPETPARLLRFNDP